MAPAGLYAKWTCDSANHYVDDGNGVCVCDATNHYVDDGNGGCEISKDIVLETTASTVTINKYFSNAYNVDW